MKYTCAHNTSYIIHKNSCTHNTNAQGNKTTNTRLRWLYVVQCEIQIWINMIYKCKQSINIYIDHIIMTETRDLQIAAAAAWRTRWSSSPSNFNITSLNIRCWMSSFYNATARCLHIKKQRHSFEPPSPSNTTIAHELTYIQILQ